MELAKAVDRTDRALLEHDHKQHKLRKPQILRFGALLISQYFMALEDFLKVHSANHVDQMVFLGR